MELVDYTIDDRYRNRQAGFLALSISGRGAYALSVGEVLRTRHFREQRSALKRRLPANGRERARTDRRTDGRKRCACLCTHTHTHAHTQTLTGLLLAQQSINFSKRLPIFALWKEIFRLLYLGEEKGCPCLLVPYLVAPGVFDGYILRFFITIGVQACVCACCCMCCCTCW